MIGIYKIANDLNDKVYIGQSTDIKRRFKQYIQDVLNESRRNRSKIHKVMWEYGIEHFSFEIIEECNFNELDDREIYWIKYYDSFHNGYNSTAGGKTPKEESHPKAIVTKEDVWAIRELYNQHVPFRMAWNLYKECGLAKKGFQNIWKNQTWKSIHQDVYTDENKKWHSTFAVGHSEDQKGLSSQDRQLTQEEVDAIYKDFLNGYSISQLVKKYNRDYGTIQRYISNPVVSKVNFSGIKIKNKETQKVFSSISSAAHWAKCGATTIRRHLYDKKSAGTVPEMNVPAHWEPIE